MIRARYREAWRLCRLTQPTRLRQLLAFAAVLAATAFTVIPSSAVAVAADGSGPPSVAITTVPEVFPVEEISGAVDDLVFTEANLDGSLIDEGGTRFRLDANVLFAFDKADLTPKAGAVLDDLVARLTKNGATRLRVDGYTDNVGDAAYNLSLSKRRAEAVRARLADDLGEEVAVTAAGHGEDDPIADNATKEGQAKNRRVTVTVLP
ncbi:MAG: OmpA family protein [Tetrasphaera sp.]